MRLLVACSQCRRRYDATGRKIGSRFRCHCGVAVTVAQPQGHESRVVRCSACGAPREGGTPQCGFCHSDFTLHERDLHTVCPNCFTRVSDAARYCHSCAAQLTAENMAGDVTKHPCPACQAPDVLLRSRRLGVLDHAMMECDRCAGLWLGTEMFAELTRHALSQGREMDPLFARRRKIPPAALTPAAGGSFYRPCAQCGKLMARRNYGRRSGVILDLCADHGVWFDGDELPRVLAWIRSGGKAKADQQIEAERRASEREAERKRSIPGETPRDSGDDFTLGQLAAETVEALVWLFSGRL